MSYDLVIRNGTIVDGTGRPPYVGDVAVRRGVIAAVGAVSQPGMRQIDATGLLVTPGFIDLHTHYDGQCIWSDRLNPSSAHGVTTALMGNCGVGFAPCRTADHDALVDMMAGVEDIPGVVMTDGLAWTWETFPQFLDAVAARPRDIDVAAYLPHSPLRAYVMGRRGVNREPATAADLATMRALAAEAVQVGALGFSSSQLMTHRTESGAQIPSYGAGDAELLAIARGVADGGGGLIQFVPDLPSGGYQPVLQQVFDAAGQAGLPVTFTLLIGNAGEPMWRDALDMVEKANAGAADRRITAQVFPRPIGLITGLDLSINPFVLCPSYRQLAGLPLDQRVHHMRKPEVRQRILADTPSLPATNPIVYLAQLWDWVFPLGDSTAGGADYEPDPSTSIAARARARGVTPAEEAYDRLLDDDGHAVLLNALANFPNHSLDTVGALLRRDDVVLGLGDGGAHYGMICDSSFPTYLLAHWARDRVSGRLSVPEAVRELTSVPAQVAGLADRGRIAVGYKADLNVVDHDRLRLHKPVVRYDLPAGGRRLDQTADGYVATIVSGEVIAENGIPTTARPGALVRGRQPAPPDR